MAEELGRIPDFADNKIGDKDLEALVNISDYYFKSKNPKIKEAFKEMLDAGIKDKRAYCSPLEALKWLAEKHEFKEGSELYVNDPLNNYTLTRLIFAAWEFREGERWSDFKEVTEGLNTPELVLWYMKNNLRIKFHAGHIAYHPKQFLRIKKGDCKDFAVFAACCLAKSGYDAKVLAVLPARRKGSHAVCVYREDDQFFIIDFYTRSGPFNSYSEAARGSRRSGPNIKGYHVQHWSNRDIPVK